MNAAIQREEAVFDAARQLTNHAERAAFLDEACADDPALRARVEGLLAAATGAERFFATDFSTLKRPAGRADSGDGAGGRERGLRADSIADENLGTLIGHYKLLQRIGEGGCGTVYMAQQEEPVRRRVALKIIKLGMDTKSVIARFEAERQALAMMDHPNIARVLDAGATTTGRPYFVMELVRGVKITDFCNENHLDTRRRLDLFIQICHAIQHAHQKGIIHRDIKPSNILVTLHDGVPVPKVIDFGIAKATSDQWLTDKTLFTAYEQFIGTPAYMSPEQAEMSGLDVDTRSDIYSLGVLLYELLTGRTPFDSKELLRSGLDEMRRTLREKEPQRPSTMLTTFRGDELTATALQRESEPPKLISLLRGDLDWVVMKALEKDRTRRYETANGLAIDVQRYLENEPVAARPPSRLYRFQKLVGRNRVPFAAAAVVAVALVIGLGVSSWLFLRERKARQRAVAAEHQEARLREVAERGRINEGILRRQAEARMKITQAVVKLGQNRFEEADQLIADISFPQATLEGAAVFRLLGEWNAMQGRWKESADRLSMLLRVDPIETLDISTLDYSRCGVAIVEQGDEDRYEEYRRAAIAHYAGTTDPVVAERTLKNSLLLPADESVLASLAPLAEIAVKSVSGTNSVAGSEPWEGAIAWRCVSLALIEYRRGHSSETVSWGKRCLSYGAENPARVATIRAILAMSHHQLGQLEEARSELAQSRTIIENKFKDDLDLGDGTKGFWFDWCLGRILLREAITLIEGSPGVALGPSHAQLP
jgi:eukaryotic-like serine/threonine-protein kinase